MQTQKLLLICTPLVLILVLVFILTFSKWWGFKKLLHQGNLGNLVQEKKREKIFQSAHYISIKRLIKRQKYMEDQFMRVGIPAKKHLGLDKYEIGKNIDNILNEGYIDKSFYLKNKKKVDCVLPKIT